MSISKIFYNNFENILTLIKTKLICGFIIFLCCHSLQAQIITTIAGTGVPGNSGNGGPAIAAQLKDPRGTFIDKSGNIYFADRENNVVKKITPNGIISIFAGTGVKGYSGDGGLATSAKLGFPYGICADKNGNIYITDQLYSVVRKVDVSGTISTIAGNGVANHMGDGGPAINASFYFPSGICIDPLGNIYVSDPFAVAVRKIDVNGTISTFAGTPVTIGYSGDNGAATNALMSAPMGIDLDDAGNLYITDGTAIRKVNTSGIITTIAGGNGSGYTGDGGQAKLAQIGFAGFMQIAGNDIYFSDSHNNVIRKIDESGIITTIAGIGTKGYSGDGGLAINCRLNQPEGISIDNEGNIYFADTFNSVIRKIGGCPVINFLVQPADQQVCEGAGLKFEVEVNDALHFRWQSNDGNGWDNLNDNSIYSGTTTSSLSLKTADIALDTFLYRCIVSNNCAEKISIPAKLTVVSSSTPTISIYTDTNSICKGSLVTFTATSLGTGLSPSLQWTKNGINTGTNSPLFADSTLQDGDVISCILTPGFSCLNIESAISNSIVIKIIPIQNLSVNITASANNICAGSPVTFNAVVENGGSNTKFQWRKNKQDLGINSSASYSENNLNNNDTLTCLVETFEGCPASQFALSNIIIMKVALPVSPAITIATENTNVCEGSAVTFSSTVTHAGISPTYQWLKNGIKVGTNSNSYKDNHILSSDIILCSITSSATCITSTFATSNLLRINIIKLPIVSLDKTTTLCVGSSRLLDAGNYLSYAWNNGTTGKTLSVNQTGIYHVTVTDGNGCKGSDTTKILSLLPKPFGFLPMDTSICNYGSITLQSAPGYKKYLWNNFLNTKSITISKPGNYWLEVTDKNNCTGRDSIIVSKRNCMAGFYIGNAFSPNNDGINDFFKPILYGDVVSYQFVVYDQWGQVVFRTNDISSGWDGTIKNAKQSSNIFVWMCSFQFEGQTKEIRKGSVLLTR